MTPAFLARDDSFIAVAKTAGDLVIPDRLRKEGPTLFDRTRAAVGGTLYLVHRLDRETSGVVLFARTVEAQRLLSAAFERGEVEKEYVALVDGLPRADEGRIDLPIAAARKGRMVVRDGGKSAATRWAVRERFARHAGSPQERTLLAVFPETGRTHQIRVHLAAIGHPLVGDRRYNPAWRAAAKGDPPPAGSPIDRVALHAAAIVFPLSKQRFRVEAPLPADFARALERLRGTEPGRTEPYR